MGYMLNVSFMVEPTVYANWYNFMYEKFIPFVKEQQKEIGELVFSRILSDTVQNHYTFSLLVHIGTLDGYKFFKDELMSEYSEFAVPMFGVNVTHFMTLMKKI